jgi:hypothetical protein
MIIDDNDDSKKEEVYILNKYCKIIALQNKNMLKDVLNLNKCIICLMAKPRAIDKIQCKTCHMIFHTDCLYNWNKIRSGCPVCKLKIKIL